MQLGNRGILSFIGIMISLFVINILLWLSETSNDLVLYDDYGIHTNPNSPLEMARIALSIAGIVIGIIIYRKLKNKFMNHDN